MGVFILERLVTARRDSLAVTTYVMNGFNNLTECIDTWRIISGENNLKGIGLYTQEEYPDLHRCHPVTTTGKAILITKDSNEEVHLRTMIPLMMKLLTKKNILLVNIVKDKAHDMIFSIDETKRMKMIAENFRKNILFDRPNGVGEYMHSSGTDEDLVEILLRSKVNGSDGIVILYDDIALSQMQRIENKLWHIPHDSVGVTQYATFHIIVARDSVINLHKIGEGLVSEISLGKIYTG